jgi:hypothetical protein
MDSDSSIFWFGLEPDLLGEYLVLRNWKKEAAFSLNDTWQDKLQNQLALFLALNGNATESLTRLCLNFVDNNPLLENDYN